MLEFAICIGDTIVTIETCRHSSALQEAMGSTEHRCIQVTNLEEPAHPFMALIR